MKKIFASIPLALMALHAHASPGVLANMPNSTGGLIQLTDDSSDNCSELDTHTQTQWWYARTRNPNGVTYHGCWRIAADDNTLVEVVWWVDEDAQMRTYKTTDFTRTPYGEALARKSRKKREQATNKGSL